MKVTIEGYKTGISHEIELPFYVESESGQYFYCIHSESKAIYVHDGYKDNLMVGDVTASIALNDKFKSITSDRFHEQLAKAQTKLYAVNQFAKDLLIP